MASSDMSFWIGFFKEAGIPAGEAANYAVTFTDNRITRSMLMDLTKEYLNDMGLSILGDVIAVLKHAKTVFNQDVRDRVLRDTSAQQETPTLKRSTPASRTIGHYLSGSDRSASPQLVSSIPKLSKEMSARLGSPITTAAPTAQPLKEEVPVQKKKKVFPEDEGHYTINLPQGSTDRTKKILAQHRQQAELQRIRAEEGSVPDCMTIEKKRVAAKKHSVFHRLGSEKKTTSPDISDSSPTVTITGLDSINMPSTSMGNQTIFSRLGGKTTVKRAATSTVSLDDDDSDDRDDDAVVAGPILEYAGVLKASPSKKAKIVTAKKIMKSAQKTLARAKSVEHKTEETLG
ncbi:CS047-like protein [Mya arenaria]|uniref:CS047-like protein n=1 Tax=Mya arenaria TaxID=6604 RepID=A0ABY7FAL6_MYAAR|nr:CS047-like protein [Mya arenaria]